MMNDEWIKLYREIKNHWIWKEKEPFDRRSAWIYIVLSANQKDEKVMFRGNLLEIKRGQFPTSIRTLSERWMWSVSKVKRFIDVLESEHMVKHFQIKNGTLLTVVNYGFYDGSRNTQETQAETLCETPKEHSKNTQSSVRNTDTEHKMEEKKEGFDVSNNRDMYYTYDDRLNQAFLEFLKMRKSIKKPLETKTGITRAMNKLKKLSGGDPEISIQILEQSIYHCWQDLYELKNDKPNTGKSVYDEWRDA